MQLRAYLLSTILSLLPFAVMAGGGHNHDHGHSHSHTPVNQATAKTKASKIVAAFVKRKKLDKSWDGISASSVEKKVFKGNPEWVAVFVNKNITDTKKQNLYVFMTLGGDYIAANFTGK